MSHVDEGSLHAYLDGALDEYPAAEARRVREHLATCAACAERLTEERRVREDARAILDLAAPQVELPTFEELRAYVRAGQSQRRALGRLHKMGWAASVVLALGTGWFLRGGQVDPMRTFQAESGPASASSERDADEVGTAATPLSPQAAPGGVAPPAEEVDRDAPADAVADAPAPARPAAEPPAAVVLERAAANAPAAGTGARAEVAQATPQPAPSSPSPEIVTDAVVADARSFDDAQARADAQAGAAAGFGAAVAGLDSQKTDAARVQERLDSAARAAESRRRIAADQVVTSTLDAAAPPAPLQRGRAANNQAEDVEREEGSASLVVPGLPVLDVLPVSEGTAFAGVRALQRLESGDTLEVFHLPEGIDPSLLAEPASGTSQLVRQTPEGWLVMRAPLTMLQLEQLLERLQAER